MQVMVFPFTIIVPQEDFFPASWSSSHTIKMADRVIPDKAVILNRFPPTINKVFENENYYC